MSETIFTPPGEVPASFSRWDIPVKMGLLIGLVSIVLSTVAYMFIMPKSYIGFLISTGVMFIVAIALYYMTGARQRKAMGGYITLKDAFAAIFVAIVISTLITTIWGVVYAKVIDPHVSDKVKEGALSYLEGLKWSQERIDEAAANFDKQAADSLKPGLLLFSYAKSLVVTSIFGFICALIVRRTPKQTMM